MIWEKNKRIMKKCYFFQPSSEGLEGGTDERLENRLVDRKYICGQVTEPPSHIFI